VQNTTNQFKSEKGKKEVMKKKNNVISFSPHREEKKVPRRRGDKWQAVVWTGQFYPNGKKKYRREGMFPTLGEAKSREEELLQEIQHRLSDSWEKNKGAIKFEQVANEWLEQKKRRSKI